MRHHRIATRVSTAACALAAMLMGSAVQAQKPGADLTVLPPTPTDYTPKKTSWGDWDFTGIWPIENIASTRILFQRQKSYGNRVFITQEEHDKRVANAKRSDSGFTSDSLNAGGTKGLEDWVKTSDFARRTSMLVKPADGQLPALTPKAAELYKNGRSGWVPRQEFDWISDFDTWDRCVSRGFPASMFPFRYNYGQRIVQSPGYVTIVLEMLGTRVIPIGNAPQWPGAVEAWMGQSRAHWEGKTLVIKTTNIKSGDSATTDMARRAAAPLNMATQNVPPFNTIPTSAKANTVEKLTMTGPNSILYEITYDDPEVFTAPWTAQLEWTRNEAYEMPEYACHEGNVMLRNYISASRAHRAQVAAGESKAIESDTRDRFAQQFDFDPVAPGGAAPPRRPN
jgi:hypothetical protein